MKAFIIFFILNPLLFAEDGSRPKWMENADVGKNMSRIHFQMKKSEVESIIGPPHWRNGEMVGDTRSGVFTWQIELLPSQQH